MPASWSRDLRSALPPPVTGLLDRAKGLSDRLLSSESFQARAAAFPLTRIIARRRARDLFDLCAGFVYSQTLLACVELRLFDVLLDRPLSLHQLAARLQLNREACTRLLSAAVALRLVEMRGEDRYGLGPLGASLARNPSLTAMIEHHRHLYEDMRDPVALLRGDGGETQLSRYWPYADAPEPAALSSDQVSEYSSLMALSQPLVAEEVLDAYAVGQHRCILDVGGGEGAFLQKAAERAPKLQLMLFDLPAVSERATATFARLGLQGRAAAFGGNFLSQPLPKGADLISLVRILLDHDDSSVLRLLKACREALCQDGTLLIAEPMVEPGDRIASAYFNMYLLAMGRGRPRTTTHLSKLLNAAGFEDITFSKGRRVLRTGIAVARMRSA
ncbi:MAG: methyltransferase [Hyphomicrobiaceae bacterium]|nr:methyltransferase [Hyphomicrobiaceae bacterium]